MKLKDTVITTANRAICKSYAKLNLTLDVLNKREDGYHNVSMVMQTISLFDLLIIDKSDFGISINCNKKSLPCNRRNIAYQAAELFFEKTNIKSGIKILIHKNIPISAGMAGGSGNAAAVLVGLNALFGYPLNEKEILELGLCLGADVPFCIECGTAVCEGIGEIITPIEGMKPTTVLLVKPDLSISTKTIYEQIDSLPPTSRPDNNAIISAINTYDLPSIAGNLNNIMESVTERLAPEIPAIKKQMIEHGALGSLMTGSGSTVFGLFDDDEKAYKAKMFFDTEYKDVFICKTIN